MHRIQTEKSVLRLRLRVGDQFEIVPHDDPGRNRMRRVNWKVRAKTMTFDNRIVHQFEDTLRGRVLLQQRCLRSATRKRRRAFCLDRFSAIVEQAREVTDGVDFVRVQDCSSLQARRVQVREEWF